MVGAVGASFVLEELELSEPRPDEVLVQIAGCGVCHADSLARQGDMPFPLPGVLGHEGAGTVLAAGDQVDNLAERDRVVLGMPWCGRCRNCLAGQPRYCADVLRLIAGGGRSDGTSSLTRRDGSALHSHFFGQSSFSTHVVVRANQAVRIAPDAPLELMGPLGCGLSTGAGAVFNVLRPAAGATLVVFGAGTVGLAAIMAARCSGATTIVAVDRHQSRLALALDVGATHAIKADETTVSTVHEICGGPADLSLECTGNMTVLRQAVDSIGMLGVCGLIGGAPAGATLEVDHLSTMIGKRIVGIHGGEGRSPELIRALLDLWRQGRFPFDRLVESFPLEAINDAVTAAEGGEVVKAVLQMPTSLPKPRRIR